MDDPQAIPAQGMMRRLDPAQWEVVRAAFKRVDHHVEKTVISRRGDQLDASLLVVAGIVGRQVPQERSRGHLVSLQVPGDFVDLHAFPLKRLDHDVVAITPVRVAVVCHRALRPMLDADVALSRALWALTLVDASVHRHWALRNGAMRARVRLANFLCEMEARLRAAGLSDGRRFALPLTQDHMADACGMTNVHLNRVLRELREDGLCTVRGGEVEFPDLARMHHAASFEPGYLYLPQ
ncbi:MAG: Crp/Fnr family transcriptional regulator [Paracoccaceae bacterium]